MRMVKTRYPASDFRHNFSRTFQQVYIDGFFHADLPSGQFVLSQRQRVALLDCGMVGRL